MKPYRKIVRNRGREHDERADWFSGVWARVAEVDHSTLSVKVVIDKIDEALFHDEWIPVLTPFVGPPGYGAAFMPAVGSEVVLFSEGNEGETLFAISRFNEKYTPPAEAADGSRVVKSDTPLRLLCAALIQIIGQQTVLLQAAQQADVKGQSVRLLTGGGEMFRVEGDNAGFRGAAIARRALPPPGPTDTPLTIAMRQLLIDLKLAE